MANVLSSFLVGIGLDTTDFDKGVKDVDSGLGNVKKSALQLAALAGGAFGINALTFGFAQATDQLGKFSQVFGVLPDDVAALGRAVSLEGGSLEGLMGTLAGIEQLRASTPQAIGGLFAQAGVVGLDPSIILGAKDATEAYLNLSTVIEGLSTKGRLQAANVFGLTEADIRLLSNYRHDIDMLVESQRKLRPVTQEMIDISARFNDVNQDLVTSVGSVADQISVKLLPHISDAVEGMTEWIQANRTFISSGIDTVLDPMADHITEIALAGGLLASGGLLTGLAGMAKFVPLIGGGLSIAAIAAAKLTAIGAAGAGGFAVGSVISENLDNETQLNIGRSISRVAALFGNEEAIQALTTEARAGGISAGFRPEQNQLQDILFPFLAEIQAQQQRMPPVQVIVKMDSQVVVDKIVEVNEQLNETAMQDLKSSARD